MVFHTSTAAQIGRLFCALRKSQPGWLRTWGALEFSMRIWVSMGLLLVFTALAVACGGDEDSELVIMTHDSFAVSEELIAGARCDGGAAARRGCG